MNQLLFDRASGILAPQTFERIQTSARIQSIQPAPRLRFNGGEKEVPLEDEDGDDGDIASHRAERSVETKIWSHQAGVNALALDIEGRMYAVSQTLPFPWLILKVSYLEVQNLPSSSGTLKSSTQDRSTYSHPPELFLSNSLSPNSLTFH